MFEVYLGYKQDHYSKIISPFLKNGKKKADLMGVTEL